MVDILFWCLFVLSIVKSYPTCHRVGHFTRSVQYSPMCHFGIFFLKYEMADYSAHFHKKFILKKSIIFAKFKKQNVVCAHEFSWFAKKVEFWLLFHVVFLLIKSFSTSQTAY